MEAKFWEVAPHDACLPSTNIRLRAENPGLTPFSYVSQITCCSKGQAFFLLLLHSSLSLYTAGLPQYYIVWQNSVPTENGNWMKVWKLSTHCATVKFTRLSKKLRLRANASCARKRAITLSPRKSVIPSHSKYVCRTHQLWGFRILLAVSSFWTNFQEKVPLTNQLTSSWSRLSYLLIN